MDNEVYKLAVFKDGEEESLDRLQMAMANLVISISKFRIGEYSKRDVMQAAATAQINFNKLPHIFNNVVNDFNNEFQNEFFRMVERLDA